MVRPSVATERAAMDACHGRLDVFQRHGLDPHAGSYSALAGAIKGGRPSPQGGPAPTSRGGTAACGDVLAECRGGCGSAVLGSTRRMPRAVPRFCERDMLHQELTIRGVPFRRCEKQATLAA